MSAQVVKHNAIDDELAKEALNNGFLDYNNIENPRMTEIELFYYNNHVNMTVDYVLNQKKTICKLEKTKMTMWDALMLLKDIVDDSDPDTSSNQLVHAIQTAEGCRKLFPDKDWMHLVGLIHDCGKFLCHPKGYNLPSWTAHGDSFPVGCRWGDSVIFRDFFKDNPDSNDSRYNTLYGIYSPNCGFDNVHMSFGHDEYMYWVLKKNANCYLNEEALYIIRYHSFHPFHYNGDYYHLASEKDFKYLNSLKEFARADLYTKKLDEPNFEVLETYYKPLIEKYCPGEFMW